MDIIIYTDTIGVQIKPVISPSCTNDLSCYEYGLRSDITEVLLPRETMAMLENPLECSIKLGCSYEIFVETSKLQLFSNITYNTPGRYHIIFEC